MLEEGTMRYMLETPWGRFTEDGSRFEFNYQRLASETGYSVDELRSLGVLHCYRHPRQEMGHMSEASAVLVGAAMRQAA
jgi:hypothetical protein